MDWTSVVLIGTAALGAFFRALNTNDQKWKSIQTLTDVVVGGAVGVLTPLLWTIPGKNLIEQGAIMFLLSLAGLQTVKDGLAKFGVAIPKFTASSLVAFFVPLALMGCATTYGAKAQQTVAPRLGPDLVGALTELKNFPLLTTVANDAKATRAWADKTLSATGTNPDPVKYQLALACPTATDAVGGLINQTIDSIITQITAMTTPPDPNAPQGFLMLFLTQLKYGPQPDPKAQLAGLRGSLALQMDALFTGCAHLFPKKQANDLVKLLGKAGIVGFTGGAAAPFIGLLP
jgi:hypothetical protein